MNRKKNVLMSPLNSNKLKNVSLYNKSKQCYNHSSQMFSFLFFFFSIYVLSIKKKKFFLSSFFFLSYAAFNNIQVSFLSFFSFFFHLHCPVAFFSLCFFFGFIFFIFFIFIQNKLLIQCLFFLALYLPLSVLTLIL